MKIGNKRHGLPEMVKASYEAVSNTKKYDERLKAKARPEWTGDWVQFSIYPRIEKWAEIEGSVKPVRYRVVYDEFFEDHYERKIGNVVFDEDQFRLVDDDDYVIADLAMYFAGKQKHIEAFDCLPLFIRKFNPAFDDGKKTLRTVSVDVKVDGKTIKRTTPIDVKAEDNLFNRYANQYRSNIDVKVEEK